MQEQIKKLIDKKILKKETIIDMHYLKKYMDSVNYVMVRDYFIVNNVDGYDIHAMCISDRFPVIVDVNNIISIDGMEPERLIKAYSV